MECMIHEAPLEEPYPEGTELDCCIACVAELTGNSTESVLVEELARRYRERDDEPIRFYTEGVSNERLD